jgi:hypothetical protein
MPDMIVSNILAAVSDRGLAAPILAAATARRMATWPIKVLLLPL